MHEQNTIVLFLLFPGERERECVRERESEKKLRMSNTFFHKPELALRRALELQGIHQNVAAITLLHDVLSSRRNRTWSPVFEQIMIAYLDLCLKLHRAREAKDGLHQYRNLAQSQAPGSLEKVIRYLLEKAEDQCGKAKTAADAAAAAASEAPTPLSVLDDGALIDYA